jgi:hypothetical protein
MKRIIFLAALLSLFNLTSSAQTENGVLPAKDGKAEIYTEWKKVELTIDGEKVTYEYRIAFQKRKALACYYDLQIKNTSAKKLKIKVKTHYYDKLVKGNFGDEFKETIKPGNITSFIVLTQGCKGDKEKKDQEDFDRCRNGCEPSYEISVSLD